MTPIRYRRIISRNVSEPRIHARDIRPLVIVKNAEGFDGLGLMRGQITGCIGSTAQLRRYLMCKKKKERNRKAADLLQLKKVLEKFL